MTSTMPHYGSAFIQPEHRSNSDTPLPAAKSNPSHLVGPLLGPSSSALRRLLRRPSIGILQGR
jgi:hypothetical protein